METPVFDDRYYSKRVHIAWRAPHIVKALIDTLSPQSVLDVGCSIGEFVKEFNDHDVAALGVDLNDPGQHNICPKYFVQTDILDTSQITSLIDTSFDLVMSLMMIQFIDKKDWPQLAKNLIALTNENGHILTVTDATGFHTALNKSKRIHYSDILTTQFKEAISEHKDKTAIRAIYNCARIYTKI